MSVTLPSELASLPPKLLPLESGPGEVGPAGAKPSAVLILFYPLDGEPVFPLTVRPDTLTRHPGQIALPGGRAERSDRSLWCTAVRETEEELGVPAGEVTPVGRLEAYHLPVSNYLITPFVGWLPSVPVYRIDPREVAHIFTVHLTDLLDPDLVREEERFARGGRWISTYYQFGEHRVWGATAHILDTLAVHLRPPRPGELRAGTFRPAEAG